MRLNVVLSLGFVATWASGFVGAELGTRHAGATTLMAWRFLILGAAAAVWLTTRARRLARGAVAWQVLIGLLAQSGYLYGIVVATQLGVPAGTSALIAALQPVVAAAAVARRPSRFTVAGLAAGLAGTALVVSDDLDGTAPAWAFALPAAAMASLVAATLLQQRVPPRHTPRPADALAIQSATSAVVAVTAAAATGTLEPPATGPFWAAVAWVIALSTLGGYGFYWAVAKRLGPVGVSGLLYLTPPATALWAWAMFGTPPSVVALAGMGVAAAAVALLARGLHAGTAQRDVQAPAVQADVVGAGAGQHPRHPVEGQT